MLLHDLFKEGMSTHPEKDPRSATLLRAPLAMPLPLSMDCQPFEHFEEVPFKEGEESTSEKG